MTDNLKPCPFCGSSVEIHEHNGNEFTGAVASRTKN